MWKLERFPKLVYAFTLFLITVIATFPVEASAAGSIAGIVYDEHGMPLEGAEISLWKGDQLVETQVTSSDGRFTFSVEAQESYSVYAFADDSTTPGVDYLPSKLEAEALKGPELVFNLLPAASVSFEGDVQFIEYDDPPDSVVYTVLDSSGRAFEVDGLSLLFGPETFLSSLAGLNEAQIIVPAEVPIKIRVTSYIVTGVRIVRGRSYPQLTKRVFDVDAPQHFILEKGEMVAWNILDHSIPFNIDVVNLLLEEVRSSIEDMEALGFYLTPTKTSVKASVRLLSEAEKSLNEGNYVDSFDAVKKAYIELSREASYLNGVYGQASLSVVIIIEFLALASTAVAFLLFNKEITKGLGSVIVYSFSLVVLYLSHPGSSILTSRVFLITGIAALAATLLVVVVIPQLFKGTRFDSYIPVRSILANIFSIAKRNVLRRRLRFLLTFASVFLLVMSFVALTSFSKGYGLVVSRVSSQVGEVRGVMLRDSDYTGMEPVYLSSGAVDYGWIEGLKESVIVSAKAESYPKRSPITRINGQPIWGVMAFDPLKESVIFGVENALLAGSLPSSDGLAISETLKNSLQAEIGDRITFGVVELEIQGIFNDDVLGEMKEFDGSPYLPQKIVNTMAGGDVLSGGDIPQYVLEPCSPHEVIVVHISQAVPEKLLTLLGISRINVILDQNVDPEVFARRMALERGYMAWSVSQGGVLLFHLGSSLHWEGLGLFVPWVIVVLNVVVTMLNSMFERRKEIPLLSSVGLNPTQIASIFLVESSILGLTAGGLGYLGGLGVYKVASFLDISIEVYQKISAIWTIASVAVAITAVLMGSFVALRNSVVITPSLRRRWKIDSKSKAAFEPWEIEVPIRLLPKEAESFKEFLVMSLKNLSDHPLRRVTSMKILDDGKGSISEVKFIYIASRSTTDNFYTENTLFFESGSDGRTTVKLKSRGEPNWARVTGSLLRNLAIKWVSSAEKTAY